MSVINKLLDLSIVASFDSTGFIRHQRDFTDESSDLSDKKYLVTGGTKGIGKAVCDFIRAKKGDVYHTGRFYSDGNQNYISLDMAEWWQIKNTLLHLPSLDGVVLNAGGMPDKLMINSYGYEYQFASQLVGHYLMVRFLIDMNKLKKGAKIIWVTSGGMYLKKYVPDMFGDYEKNYDKVATYANTKRAQVIVCQMMAQDPLFKDYTINCMHPGWVDTEGVREAIPGFRKIMKNRLRDSMQGADTINWLLFSDRVKTSGNLYFDRTQKGVYPFFWTKEDSGVRDDLYLKLNQIYDGFFKEIS